MGTFILAFLGLVLAVGLIAAAIELIADAKRTPARRKRVVNNKGVSGGKATGAILTGGVSLLATGLSRKEAQTQARCGHCTSSWAF